MKILVADDELCSRLVLREALFQLGHDVVETSDGWEAWNCHRNGDIRIVITDWMMPNIDGLQLCQMIRNGDNPRYTYVIMLTALGGKGNFLEGMKSGADDYITKPFDLDELEAKLIVAVRILRLQDEVKQLEGLLRICSYCNKIRTESDVWEPLDIYVSNQIDAPFSHSVCPSCLEVHVKPQVERLKQRRLQRGMGKQGSGET
jgi:DNA-binding response OmpR family regulator